MYSYPGCTRIQRSSAPIRQALLAKLTAAQVGTEDDRERRTVIRDKGTGAIVWEGNGDPLDDRLAAGDGVADKLAKAKRLQGKHPIVVHGGKEKHRATAANELKFHEGVDCYLEGDHKRAKGLWLYAANRGHAFAQYNLAEFCFLDLTARTMWYPLHRRALAHPYGSLCRPAYSAAPHNAGRWPNLATPARLLGTAWLQPGA